MPTRWVIGLASGSAGEGADAALLDLQGAGLELHPRTGPRRSSAVPGRTARGPAPGRLRLVRRQAAEPAAPAGLGETFAAAARQPSPTAPALACPRPAHRLSRPHRLARPRGTVPLRAAARDGGRRRRAHPASRWSSDFAARPGGRRPGRAAGGAGRLSAVPPSRGEPQPCCTWADWRGSSYLPAGCRMHEVIGFEAGPCNGLLDALMRQLTERPRNATTPAASTRSRGAASSRCCSDARLAHPGLQRRPPRACRDQPFGEEFARQAVSMRQHEGRLHDLLCTAATLRRPGHRHVAAIFAGGANSPSAAVGRRGGAERTTVAPPRTARGTTPGRTDASASRPTPASRSPRGCWRR